MNMGLENKCASLDLREVRRLITEYLDGHGARHAMVGYPYVCAAAEFLVTHPEARARRQLRAALEYVEATDEGGRGKKAIDRCIRTMIVQMNDDVTVKELVFAIADHVCLAMGVPSGAHGPA